MIADRRPVPLTTARNSLACLNWALGFWREEG